MLFAVSFALHRWQGAEKARSWRQGDGVLEADIGLTTTARSNAAWTAHSTQPVGHTLADQCTYGCCRLSCAEHVTYRTEVCRTHFSTGGACDYRSAALERRAAHRHTLIRHTALTARPRVSGLPLPLCGLCVAAVTGASSRTGWASYELGSSMRGARATALSVTCQR